MNKNQEAEQQMGDALIRIKEGLSMFCVAYRRRFGQPIGDYDQRMVDAAQHIVAGINDFSYGPVEQVVRDKLLAGLEEIARQNGFQL